jgi:arginine exporter protein ArgO
MRPLTVITGILLGSSLAITISLAAVLIVFLILGDDYPRIQHEFESLVASVCIFFGMTTISAGSFYSLLINHRARFWAQLLMWAGLAATTWYYLP